MTKSKESKKIGEGTFGEVFSFVTRDGEKTVVKIAPTGGMTVRINDALPKKPLEMAMEVTITGLVDRQTHSVEY